MALFRSGVARKSGPLERLGKVVVLEDVLECKAALDDEDATPTELLQQMRKLNSMHISYETLDSTLIGRAVRRHRKHSDERVVAAVRELVRDKALPTEPFSVCRCCGVPVFAHGGDLLLSPVQSTQVARWRRTAARAEATNPHIRRAQRKKRRHGAGPAAASVAAAAVLAAKKTTPRKKPTCLLYTSPSPRDRG